jgi:hypothetical protein
MLNLYTSVTKTISDLKVVIGIFIMYWNIHYVSQNQAMPKRWRKIFSLRNWSLGHDNSPSVVNCWMSFRRLSSSFANHHSFTTTQDHYTSGSSLQPWLRCLWAATMSPTFAQPTVAPTPEASPAHASSFRSFNIHHILPLLAPLWDWDPRSRLGVVARWTQRFIFTLKVRFLVSFSFVGAEQYQISSANNFLQLEFSTTHVKWMLHELWSLIWRTRVRVAAAFVDGALNSQVCKAGREFIF